MKAVLVKFHGPTTHKGSRLSVRIHCGGRRYYAYNHALNDEDNYRAAALRYLSDTDALPFGLTWADMVGKVELKGGYLSATEYVWVLVPRSGT